MFAMGKRARRSEDGAVAVMVALSLTALLVVAGLVVNLGQARVEKVTNRCDESVGHSGMPRSDTGTRARGRRPSSRAPWSIRSRPSPMTSRTTSSGMHAPLNSESAGSNGSSRPVEIWYER